MIEAASERTSAMRTGSYHEVIAEVDGEERSLGVMTECLDIAAESGALRFDIPASIRPTGFNAAEVAAATDDDDTSIAGQLSALGERVDAITVLSHDHSGEHATTYRLEGVELAVEADVTVTSGPHITGRAKLIAHPTEPSGSGFGTPDGTADLSEGEHDG